MSRPKSKSKSKTSKHSSREPTPKPTEDTAEKAPEASPAGWSEWIWGYDIKSFYRGRLGADKRWEYQFEEGSNAAEEISTKPMLLESSQEIMSYTYQLEAAYAAFDQPFIMTLVESATAEVPAATEVKTEESPAAVEKKKDTKVDEEKPEKGEKVTIAALKKLNKRKAQKMDRIIAYLAEQEKEDRRFRKEMRRERGRRPYVPVRVPHRSYDDDWY